jgi:hypothetical protein
MTEFTAKTAKPFGLAPRQPAEHGKEDQRFLTTSQASESLIDLEVSEKENMVNKCFLSHSSVGDGLFLSPAQSA